jgi:hypothetical protein
VSVVVEPRRHLAALWLAAAALGSTPIGAAAQEDVFSYVTSLPAVAGEHVRTVRGVDPATGRGLEKDVFQEAAGDMLVRSHVARVSCTKEVAATPFMVAVQYLPNPPDTFAGATRYDVFAEVYVTDRDGRVRLYRELGGQEMRTLTERFLPACPDV